MKFLNNKYSGVVIGGIYAFLMRLIFSHPALKAGIFKFSLFSITFVVVLPLLIGSIPILFSPKDKKISVWFSIWSPSVSVMLFFFIAFLSKIEDSICLIILLVPYLLGAILGGIIIRFFVLRKRKKNGIVYSLLILVPAVSSVVESQFATPSQVFSYTNSVVVNTTPDKIWPNIIRVRDIGENEYDKGFFYYSGVPRPLYAELDRDTLGATRIGHFQGGLKFVEKVSVWEPNKKILFDITVDDASIGHSVFDNHILKGGHFRFISACYELKPIGDHQTQLCLTSSYELDTKINGYASWWGQTLLGDFQQRLLWVVKKRCDNH